MTQIQLDPVQDWHLLRRDDWGSPRGILRVSEARKAYDCEDGLTRCSHSPRAKHGFWFDEWWYGLKKDHYLLAFGVCPCVATSIEVSERLRVYVGGQPIALRTTLSVAILGADGKAVSADFDEDGVPTRKFTETVLNQLDVAFTKQHVTRDYEQTPEFWMALEDLFQDAIAKHQRKSDS